MRIQLVAYHLLPAYVFARLKPRMFGECEMSEEAQVLDVRGLNCPLPVLKAKKAMRSLAAGDCGNIDWRDGAIAPGGWMTGAAIKVADWVLRGWSASRSLMRACVAAAVK